MKRRKFLRNSLSGGALAVVNGVLPHTAAANAEPARAEVGSFELDELTISELQEGMTRGRFTARSLTRKYLERIDEIDARGPALRSVIETNPDAQEIAERLDRERKDGDFAGRCTASPSSSKTTSTRPTG